MTETNTPHPAKAENEAAKRTAAVRGMGNPYENLAKDMEAAFRAYWRRRITWEQCQTVLTRIEATASEMQRAAVSIYITHRATWYE